MPCWCNRALCHIKLGNFKHAISDASEVLGYYDCFDDRNNKNHKL